MRITVLETIQVEAYPNIMFVEVMIGPGVRTALRSDLQQRPGVIDERSPWRP